MSSTLEFKRHGPRRFVAKDGHWKIDRPSGRSMHRERLQISSAEHEYELRFSDSEIWLLCAEREVGYAKGAADDWVVIFGERVFELTQPKAGTNHTLVLAHGSASGQIAGEGFPLRSVRAEGIETFSDEEVVFVVAIALLGWRESDRSMLGAAER